MRVCPAFVDETGVLSASLREQPVYGVGLLVVPNPTSITDSFYKLHFNFVSNRSTQRRLLRQELTEGQRRLGIKELDRLMWSTRHHEYKFSEVTSENIQQYVDLLNVYFSFPDLEFHALLVDRREGGFNLIRWGHDPWKAYLWFGRELLKRRLRRDVFAVVDLQGKPDESPEHLEDTFIKIPRVAGCIRGTSDMSVFLQVTDVLLGCVAFDWRDESGYYEGDSRRADAKRQLAAFIKTRLGFRRKERILSGSMTYRRRTKPSTFSVWKWRGAADAK